MLDSARWSAGRRLRRVAVASRVASVGSRCQAVDAASRGRRSEGYKSQRSVYSVSNSTWLSRRGRHKAQQRKRCGVLSQGKGKGAQRSATSQQAERKQKRKGAILSTICCPAACMYSIRTCTLTSRLLSGPEMTSAVVKEWPGNYMRGHPVKFPVLVSSLIVRQATHSR